MEDDVDRAALMARMIVLKARRADLRSLPAAVTISHEPTGRTCREAWDATDVDYRRRMLLGDLDHVTLAARLLGLRGPADVVDAFRVTILWNS